MIWLWSNSARVGPGFEPDILQLYTARRYDHRPRRIDCSFPTRHRDGIRQCLFCETDLPLQQLLQTAQLAAYVMQADLHQRIMLFFEPLVGRPVHALGFAAAAI